MVKCTPATLRATACASLLSTQGPRWLEGAETHRLACAHPLALPAPQEASLELLPECNPLPTPCIPRKQTVTTRCSVQSALDPGQPAEPSPPATAHTQMMFMAAQSRRRQAGGSRGKAGLANASGDAFIVICRGAGASKPGTAQFRRRGLP